VKVEIVEKKRKGPPEKGNAPDAASGRFTKGRGGANVGGEKKGETSMFDKGLRSIKEGALSGKKAGRRMGANYIEFKMKRRARRGKLNRTEKSADKFLTQRALATSPIKYEGDHLRNGVKKKR